MNKELLQKYKEANPVKYEQKFGKSVDTPVEESKAEVKPKAKKSLLKKIING